MLFLGIAEELRSSRSVLHSLMLTATQIATRNLRGEILKFKDDFQFLSSFLSARPSSKLYLRYSCEIDGT